MTRRLYYEDSFISEFDAVVTSCEPVDNGYAVTLDQTAFFPEGGGQKADTGKIGDAHVSDAEEKDGEVYHYTDSPVTVGETCKCAIDWEQRFRRMQNHTGEHIVSGIVHKVFGYNNVGFHMGADDITIDFDGYITKEQLSEIELLANRAIYDNAAVTTVFPDPEELDSIDYRSKLELTENVRLVIIEGIDVCACCAPHLKTTGQVGVIRIFDSIRHKGGVRVHMLAGLDAFEDLLTKSKNVAAISNLLSSKQNETAAAVGRLKEENEANKSEIIRLKRELEDTEIRALRPTDGNICVFTKFFDTEQLRSVVNAGMELCGGICAAFAGNDGEGWRYIMGSRNVNMRAAAKEINTALSGRGGGRETMIQGSVTATEAEIRGYFGV
jgi:alanyl-tRNA synthetase